MKSEAKDREICYANSKESHPWAPPPLLIDLAQCVSYCSKCGRPIEKYPLHTHLDLRETDHNPVYECICHKCVPVPRKWVDV